MKKIISYSDAQISKIEVTAQNSENFTLVSNFVIVSIMKFILKTYLDEHLNVNSFPAYVR